MEITNWIGALFIILICGCIGYLSGQSEGYRKAFNFSINMVFDKTSIEIQREVKDKK